jgi:hypothetical protein
MFALNDLQLNSRGGNKGGGAYIRIIGWKFLNTLCLNGPTTRDHFISRKGYVQLICRTNSMGTNTLCCITINRGSKAFCWIEECTKHDLFIIKISIFFSLVQS